MASNTADHPPGNLVNEGHHEGDFGVSVTDLRGLMELRSGEAVAKIRDTYGDVPGICHHLKTSPIEGKPWPLVCLLQATSGHYNFWFKRKKWHFIEFVCKVSDLGGTSLNIAQV